MNVNKLKLRVVFFKSQNSGYCTLKRVIKMLGYFIYLEHTFMVQQSTKGCTACHR